jgi:hypothetical protein
VSKRVSIVVVVFAGIVLPTSVYLHAVVQAQTTVSQSAAVSPAESSATPERAVLNRYCIGCHNEKLKTAGLALDLLDVTKVGEHPVEWEKVVRKLRGGLMPPPGRPRPDSATYERLVSWAETELDRAAAARPNPGRTDALHRLNRAEYVNVVRDLLALEPDVADLLPTDDASHGFDNIAGSLMITQSVLEQYLSVARRISRAAIGSPPPMVMSREYRVPDSRSQYEHIDGLPFGTRGGMLVRHNFPQDGTYVFELELMCRVSGGCDGGAGFVDEHQLEVTVDDERVHLFTIEPRATARPEGERKLRVRVPVKAGPRDVAVAFLARPTITEVDSRMKRFERPMHIQENQGRPDQSIYWPFLDRMTILGPYDAAGPGETPSRRRVFVCHPTDSSSEDRCAKTILTTLAPRAYRRPVTDTDIEPLLRFYHDGRADGGFEAGIELALQRMLVSPQFLVRVERDPARMAPNAAYRISDLELASRLSFFLWSSIPDDQLLDLAARGKLKDRQIFEQQVRRMLVDPRSKALVSNFAGQWLQLRNLKASLPNDHVFPDFNDDLRQGFRQETELFVDSVMRENRSVLELLTADYTFVNGRLARHYGIPEVYGSHFRRVTLPDASRRGLLGHGSILTVTSRPNRTSPVVRGKWILENILGTPPPDPPANVPALNENEEGSKRLLSVRERLAEHRRNAVCASCHAMIDPLGFALENFDGTGKWREFDEEHKPIETSGTLPDGVKFGNLAEFRAALIRSPKAFATTVTEKLLTYALGRGLEAYDMPAVRGIVHEAASDGFKLSSLIVGITKSIPFQMRRSANGQTTVAVVDSDVMPSRRQGDSVAKETRQ